MNWFEVFGWIGSVLVIVSLMVAKVMRFRVLNLTGAAIATVYNAAIGVWPFAVMNFAISIIDVVWIVRLLRERGDEETYEMVPVATDDAYLARVLHVHAADIAKHAPQYPGPASGTAAFLVVRGDETIGVVQVHDEGAGVGRVQLDYVTPRFRDFRPGQFVYGRSGVFRALGLRRLVVEPEPTSRDYLRRVGFQPSDEGAWVREVAA
ncbi:YgjV family protein [Cellulomonas composti]|uniref:N-acetyltransferase domain-containing protein n=1 Tax=Cellulomonas composti TaxID=266130 RepID=A0A511J7Y1_9CELL|nr:YgjV family protein [Cellulomonas composti]GEL94107.1 hypothetical protein CCO02nite_07650 [Cellulomonas composti]